jgi:hypothetical protein
MFSDIAVKSIEKLASVFPFDASREDFRANLSSR